MADRIHLAHSAHSHPRLHHSRAHSAAEETGPSAGVCALEDYTCLTGESLAMRSLRAQLRRVSPHFRVALITGEPGTCKEVVALALHRLTAESDATFISHSAVSFLALLDDALPRIKPGDRHFDRAYPLDPLSDPQEPAARALEAQEPTGLLAPGTTLYLPDVCDLSPAQQVSLLQALYRMGSLRTGSDRPRIIFATPRDLRTLAAAGQFDRNLYRKISAVEIVLPSLRSRPEDIPLITCGLLSRSARSGGMTAGAFDGRALSMLQCHDWPGNIRELERAVELARYHAGDGVDGVIEATSLPPLTEFAVVPVRRQIEGRIERLDDIIQNHVLDVLLRCGGNKVRAAERLGISRSTLYRMLDSTAAQSSQPTDLDLTG